MQTTRRTLALGNVSLWASPVAAIAVLIGCSDARDTSDESAASSSVEVVSNDAEPQSDRTEATLSSPIMIDVTDEAGIEFVHVNGGKGDYSLPEITGSGAALFDFDNDGDLDVYLVQGSQLRSSDGDGDKHEVETESPRDRLYRNELAESGRLRFTDVTKASGILATGYGMGVACADFNNDGWVDLFVTNLGDNMLLQNKGNGTFEDVTDTTTAGRGWSTSAAFFDYDRDGWLDLYVANYVIFSTEMKRRCFSKSSARDYCGPDSYDAAFDQLLRNRGDGTFEDVTVDAGIKAAVSAGLGVVCADLNDDGWLDIYVANDGDPNQLWLSQNGTGRFTDEALLAGVAVNRAGRAEAGMGVVAADFDGDGSLDLFMTHLEGESNTLYANFGNGAFGDQTIEQGLHASSLVFTSFGTGAIDYDNDGWLDLMIANGAVRLVESLLRKGDAYPLHQRNQLFHNERGNTFVDVSERAGDAFHLSEVSRGLALGDVDNDGDTDAVILNNSGRARLLLNQIGNQSHWIGLRVLDKQGKRDASHALVEVRTRERESIVRRVASDGGYCSSNDSRVLVGLGADEGPVRVRVHWPDGQLGAWKTLATDKYWTLQQGQTPQALGADR